MAEEIAELERDRDSYILTNDMKIALVQHIKETQKIHEKFNEKLDEVLLKKNTLELVLNNKYIFFLLLTLIIGFFSIYFYSDIKQNTNYRNKVENIKKINYNV